MNPKKQTVLPKTQLTRVEGENTRVQALQVLDYIKILFVTQNR
jgi:hypothetical protein